MRTLVDASLQGGALILLAWALCRALPRLPVAARCALWWLASLKLLVGLLGSPLELGLLPATDPVVVPALGAASAIAGASPTVDVAPGPAPALGLLALWALGAGLLLVHTARQWVQAARLRRRARPAGPDVASLAAGIARELGLGGRVPEVRVSPEITGPMVVGLLGPTILLSEAALRLGDEELRLALAHELAHVRRRDLLWGWIPVVAARVFFFHPLAHVALREYVLAREAACDAAVLELPTTSPQAYGALLLRLGVRRASTASVGMVSSVHQLKRRLLMMQSVSKGRFGRVSALLVLALAALVPVTVVAREPRVTRCEVIIDDEEGRRTIPCDDLGISPPPRAARAPAPAKKPLAPPPRAAVAGDVDIEACIATYEAILTCTSHSPNVPASARAQMAASLDDGIRGLRLAYKFPAARAGLADACKQLRESKDLVFETLGCE